jgi:hypothetical protein
MESDERNKFEELRLQAGCSRNFACVSSSIRDICSGKYDPDNDAIECLECESQDCGFAQPWTFTVVNNQVSKQIILN